MGWLDELSNIAGGASGIVSGLTKAADPFLAWDKVQAADQGIDKSDIQLDDLRRMQDAKNNPDLNFYGNAAEALDTTNRKTTAAGNLDIYGNQEQLQLQEYLSDPNGYFQTTVRAKGLTPGSPEYRALLAAQIGDFTPLKAPKAYDDFGVDKMENANLNEQAALQMIQTRLQQLDPNAVLQRKPDGTVVVVSNGEEHPISGDMVTKLAAMITAKTPDDAIRAGLATENTIQKTNIDLFKAVTAGQISPKAALDQLKNERVGLNQIYQGAQRELEQLRKSADYTQADDATKLAMTQDLRTRIAEAKRRMDDQQAMANRIAMTSSLPRLGVQSNDVIDLGTLFGFDAGPNGQPIPRGGSSLTTRPPPGAAAARAAGGVSSGPTLPGWGASSAGPPYPTPGGANNQRYNSPQGASGKISSLDQVLQLLQQFGVA